MDPPFESLDYLYVGSKDFDRDVAHYRDVVKAELVWAFHAFGAKVAGFRVTKSGGGESGCPLLLIADHRPAPTCMPIFSVGNLESAAGALRSRGWMPDGDMFDIPNGPAYRFTDPSGNQIAIFQNDRPNQLERAWADPDNPRAMRGLRRDK